MDAVTYFRALAVALVVASFGCSFGDLPFPIRESNDAGPSRDNGVVHDVLFADRVVRDVATGIDVAPDIMTPDVSVGTDVAPDMASRGDAQVDVGGPDTGVPTDVVNDLVADVPPACPSPRIVCGGRCTDTASDTANCGGCGHVCSLLNASAGCFSGACTVGRCLTGFGDCDRSPANGCESPLNAPVNCGTCGHACSLANATTGCAAGACSIASCNAGYGDCNHDPSDGCEAALNTSAICGACGMVCTTGMHCASGTCVTSCPSGTTSCTASGVCADTVRDPTNCGACGTACPLAANALVTCSSGACGYTCSTGYADCDGVASNGCETNLNTDVANCGSCRQRCNLPNSTAVCTDGVCAMGTCAVGFGDCDGNPANGCEVNITSSVFSCGTCNNTCSLTNAMAGCSAGACTVSSCVAGFADCDTRASNGCETSTTTNTNCGACGFVCTSGNRCVGGTCVSSCPTGTTYCPSTGACANFQSDTNNCGMCGTVCPPLANAAPSCRVGTCGFTCNAGFRDCDGNAANGCEVNLNTSVANCGGCGAACGAPNATMTCSGGACRIAACSPGFGDCDGNPTNGCESNIRADVSNCGYCRHTCGAGQICSAGACTCAATGTTTCGTACCTTATQVCSAAPTSTCTICGGTTPNACGTACTNVMTDAANCGVCGHVCGTGLGCSAGTCVLWGAVTFTTPGSFMWTVPAGVNSVSVVVVGGGGGGYPGGGGGGGLCYLNTIVVTPGTGIPIVVGSGGSSGGGGGGQSSFRGTLIAYGGGGTYSSTAGSGGSGTGGTCFSGGSGGAGRSAGSGFNGGGGGAAGYAGNGGSGGSWDGMCGGSAGSGGGGGGGTCGNGGGGVGQLGLGLSGAAGGGGGSGGSAGGHSFGGYLGGGGGGGTLGGGSGGVRIIWGVGRSFPAAAM